MVDPISTDEELGRHRKLLVRALRQVLEKKIWTDQGAIEYAIYINDAPWLLDKSITGLMIGQLDVRLAGWLADRLELIQIGDDAQALFGLKNREGAKRGKHGAGRRFETIQIVAARELAARRFATKGDADYEIEVACGIDDSGIRKLVSKFDLSKLDDETLKVMTGSDLLGRINWPN